MHNGMGMCKNILPVKSKLSIFRVFQFLILAGQWFINSGDALF